MYVWCVYVCMCVWCVCIVYMYGVYMYVQCCVNFTQFALTIMVACQGQNITIGISNLKLISNIIATPPGHLAKPCIDHSPTSPVVGQFTGENSTLQKSPLCLTLPIRSTHLLTGTDHKG